MSNDRPDLERLRRLAKAATPGPWIYSGCDDKNGDKYAREGYVNGPTSLPIPDTVALEPFDAEYIAAVDPTTLLALCDYVERLENERDAAPGEVLRAVTDALLCLDEPREVSDADRQEIFDAIVVAFGKAPE